MINNINEPQWLREGWKRAFGVELSEASAMNMLSRYDLHEVSFKIADAQKHAALMLTEELGASHEATY